MVRAIAKSAASCPDGWRLVRLGDAANVAFSSVDKKTADGEVPVELCNYTDVFYNRRIRGGMKLMAATATPVERDTWSLKKGDVLFTKDSETPDEIGVPSYVSDDMPNVLCGYHLGLARPSSDLVHGAFLARTLASRASAQEFSRIANGVTRFGLTLEATRNLPILLPPLSEQGTIAAVLDSIDEAIERTEAVIAATEQLRDSLLHELLTRGVPGWHTAWRDMPGIGTIPADWDVVRLGEVLEEGPTNGIYKPESEYGSGVWLIRIDDFVPGALVKTAGFQRIQVTEEEVARYAVRRGDILINRVNSLSHIGKSVLLPQFNEPVLFESNMMKLGVRSDVYAEFAAIVLLAQNSRSYFASRAKKAVQQVSINQQDVAQMPFPLLPLPEQHSIATILKGVDEVIKQTREEREGLQSLKASTADALLSGRVRVDYCYKETTEEGNANDTTA